jgi:hypothetical protein
VLLERPESATAFAAHFVEGYLTPAFGSRTKTEIDFLVFASLVRAGVMDPTSPLHEIARALNVTRGKARSLVLNWQLRSNPGRRDIDRGLRAVLATARFSKDGTLLVFGVENPLLREELDAMLKRLGIFADASFSGELIRLSPSAFVTFLDDFLSVSEKEAARRRLVADGQIPNQSFKAMLGSAIARLAEGVAGEVGKVVVADLFESAVNAAAIDWSNLGLLLSHVLPYSPG